MDKLRLICDGAHTYAELCGKTIGRGVNSIEFSHENKNVNLKLGINLSEFEFMPGGYFDEVEQRMNEDPEETIVTKNVLGEKAIEKVR